MVGHLPFSYFSTLCQGKQLWPWFGFANHRTLIMCFIWKWDVKEKSRDGNIDHIWALFLDFHSGCTGLARLVVFLVLFAIEFSICAKNKTWKICPNNKHPLYLGKVNWRLGAPESLVEQRIGLLMNSIYLTFLEPCWIHLLPSCQLTS